MRNALIALAGMAVVVVAVFALAGPGGGDETGGAPSPEAAAAGLRVDAGQWKTDFSRHSVPLSEFVGGGPPRAGISPLDEPAYVSQGARSPSM